jgi:hypothetical protein
VHVLGHSFLARVVDRGDSLASVVGGPRLLALCRRFSDNPVYIVVSTLMTAANFVSFGALLVGAAPSLSAAPWMMVLIVVLPSARAVPAIRPVLRILLTRFQSWYLLALLAVTASTGCSAIRDKRLVLYFGIVSPLVLIEVVLLDASPADLRWEKQRRRVVATVAAGSVSFTPCVRSRD